MVLSAAVAMRCARLPTSSLGRPSHHRHHRLWSKPLSPPPYHTLLVTTACANLHLTHQPYIPPPHTPLPPSCSWSISLSHPAPSLRPPCCCTLSQAALTYQQVRAVAQHLSTALPHIQLSSGCCAQRLRSAALTHACRMPTPTVLAALVTPPARASPLTSTGDGQAHTASPCVVVFPTLPHSCQAPRLHGCTPSSSLPPLEAPWHA